MNTFIRAIETWVPSNDRSILEFGSGMYGKATRFAAISRELCFGRGEGLPGQAWEAGHPVVLKQFQGSYFRRTAAALAEGMTCGIAVPIFAGEFLTSVVVFFCGDDDAHAGDGLETLDRDPLDLLAQFEPVVAVGAEGERDDGIGISVGLGDDGLGQRGQAGSQGCQGGRVRRGQRAQIVQHEIQADRENQELNGGQDPLDQCPAGLVAASALGRRVKRSIALLPSLA